MIMSGIKHEETSNILPEEFEIICRFCLNKNGEIKLFVYHHEGMQLSEIVMFLSLLHIEENDDLPKSLCHSCLELVQQFFSFKKQVEYSEKFLKDLKNKPIISNLIKAEEHIANEEKFNFECDSDDVFDNCMEAKIVSNTEDETIENIDTPQKIKKNKKFNNLTCSFCNLIFDNDVAYKEHRKKEADLRRKKQPCSVCNKMISTYKLKDHLNSHTKERPYQCEICREKFRFRSSLTRHNFRHAQKKPHECHICGKGFIQAPTLTDHLRTHSGEKSFICNFCGKSFITKHSLANHIYLHKVNDQNDFSNLTCKKCNKTFSTKSGLKCHMTSHSSEKDFLCSFCGKKFSTKHLLHSHIKNHSSIKPFVCEICNKGFSYKNALQKHQLTHTGEKPEVCFICKKKFSQKSHLTYHLRKHSGERPYSCTFCDKTFDHTGSLKIHIRIHTGEKPFICKICDKGFYDSSSLKKHLKTHDEIKTSSDSNIYLKEENKSK